VKRKIELLAPGGDVDSIKASIAAGADAVYCGLDRFNARSRAANISFDELQGILRLAHQHNCQVFLTLNIMVLENEIADLVRLLNQLVNTGIDGIIVQDIGLFYVLSTYFKSLQIHASTQLTTHNEGQIRFLAHLKASRVNLSRELSLQEIKDLTAVAHQNKVLTEVFVHGSSCLSFSGICYMSSVHGANSGNRGRCSQPCRDQYLTTLAGKDFPLNLKDNSAWYELEGLADAGVDSVKIEGRIKKSHYVFTVTAAWRKQIERYFQDGEQLKENRALYQVFNRDFTSAYLSDERQANMFIDNPRDHSAIHRAELLGGLSEDHIEKAKQELHDEKAEIKRQVKNQIEQLSIAKAPVMIIISGKFGASLKVEVKTPENSFVVFSEQNLANTGTEVLNYAMLFKRMKAINDTEYYIEQLDLNELAADLYLPFKALTSIKRQILFFLNNSREFIDPIAVPVLKRQAAITEETTLFVLISKTEDVHLCNETSAVICFDLPNAFKSVAAELSDLFLNNRKLIPWFPSVLIGDDFAAAVDFLQEVRPELIITNNTGIAFEAYQRGIRWIAGPYLNTANSFSLLCLKEKFNCSGAFISNEISKTQLQQIRWPDGFNLYYSIYHPILGMTSRQCLFHQLTGCEKNRMDDSCISNCEKSTLLTNVKGVNFFVEKSKGNFNCIWSASNLLNTDSVTDIPGFFSGFLVDLRDIKTETEVEMDKTSIIKLFGNHLHGKPDSADELHRRISPTTNIQYTKGV
jgi:U32 family peptidase